MDGLRPMRRVNPILFALPTKRKAFRPPPPKFKEGWRVSILFGGVTPVWVHDCMHVHIYVQTPESVEQTSICYSSFSYFCHRLPAIAAQDPGARQIQGLKNPLL